MPMSQPTPMPRLPRRALLGAAGLGALSLGALAGCTGRGDQTPAPTPVPTVAAGTYGELKVQLRWINGLEFAGLYLADANGHFEDAGFSKVTLFPGPVDSVEDLVADKVADIGISGPIATANWLAENRGPLRIVGSITQVTPYGILSLQEGRPIRSASDFIGKTVNVYSDAYRTFFRAFCTANDLDIKRINVVDRGYEVGALEDNHVDGMWCYQADEPIRTRVDGFTPVYFPLQTHGFPIPSNSYVATRDTITGRTAALKSFLAAAALGWKDVLKDPAGAAKIITDKYAADELVDQDMLNQQLVVQNTMVRDADTDKYGLFTSTEDALNQTVAAIGQINVNIGRTQLFDLGPLNALYKERPALINS